MFLNKKRRIRDEEAFSCVLDRSPRQVVHGGLAELLPDYR